MIPVTKPFLPSPHDYQRYLDGIWSRNWLTNNGPLVNELELKLKQFLKINHLLFTTNGTIALQIAIKALGLKGKVITSPFSYVATTSSLVWEECDPLFVDIDEATLNLDPDRVEEAISEDVTGILATHCFGNACDLDGLQRIASKYKLKLMYDAAHCFGGSYNGRSIFEFGDISITSFHATKIFHTIEGGGIFTKDPELLKRMAYMRNFGHDGPEKFHGVGINGKNSEFHAAMGLSILPHFPEIFERRKLQARYYDKVLAKLRVRRPKIQDGCESNHSYYPVIFETKEAATKAKLELEKKEIFTRRYFYPTLSTLDYVSKRPTPIADSISERILCLPMYYDLSREEQDMIARLLLRAQNY